MDNRPVGIRRWHQCPAQPVIGLVGVPGSRLWQAPIAESIGIDIVLDQQDERTIRFDDIKNRRGSQRA